jgi:hypothetical protein
LGATCYTARRRGDQAREFCLFLGRAPIDEKRLDGALPDAAAKDMRILAA